MLITILNWISGGLARSLTQAYEAKLKAQNDSERIAADISIQEIQAQIQVANGAKEIRLATAGFWEQRLLTFLIGFFAVSHLGAVWADTMFKLGWKVSAFPAPMDQWQGTIILGYFGYVGAQSGIKSISSALRRR